MTSLNQAGGVLVVIGLSSCLGLTSVLGSWVSSSSPEVSSDVMEDCLAVRFLWKLPSWWFEPLVEDLVLATAAHTYAVYQNSNASLLLNALVCSVFHKPYNVLSLQESWFFL